MENTAANTLNNLLITRDFDPKASINGKPLPKDADGNADISQANLFSFEYKTPNKNYGTVVILLGKEKNMTVYYGDNVGRTMESDDKKDWYDFLAQLKNFASRNILGFELDDLSRLKYTVSGMAAIKEGLFEGYYGRKNISYSDQPKQVRLMIKHNRNILEGEPRYRAIEELFVETADGERFRVPSRSLAHGRMLARHVAEGGNPYDAFGQHINNVVTELNTLGRFIRAAKHKPFAGPAGEMVEAAVRHYGELKAKAKHMISQRGYRESRELFDPAEITEADVAVENIRDLFIEQTLDHRIEEALPILAKLQGPKMREADEFESWTNRVMEGTWALPDTPEAESKLQDLLSKPLIVGADATNATEQLYDLIGDDILFDRLGDLADRDPNANCWEDPGVINRLGELGIDINPTTGPESGKPEMDEAVIPDPKYDHEPPAQESDPIPDDSDHDPIPDDEGVAEAMYDPRDDDSHDYGTDLLVTIRRLYVSARDGKDPSEQFVSLNRMKDGIAQSEEPRLQQSYNFLMKNLAGGTVTDPKMIMQITDKAHQMFHPSLEPIAQATREAVDRSQKQGVAEGSRNAYLKHNNLVDLEKPLAGLEDEFNKFLRTHDPEEKQKYQQGIKQRIKTRTMAGPKGQLPEQGVAGGYGDSAVASALTRRIMSQRLDLLKKYGPVKVTQAIDDAAEFFGDVEEIGSSDMYAYMQYVEKALGNMNEQGLAEGTSQGIMLNGKEVDMRSLEIENVDPRDYPDFSDAYIGRASFTDGTDLSDQEMDQLNDEHGDLVHELAYDSLHESDLGEDLDTDGVMMTKPSNMSSESATLDLERLKRLALM
jgi:hypothetical protein